MIKEQSGDDKAIEIQAEMEANDKKASTKKPGIDPIFILPQI